MQLPKSEQLNIASLSRLFDNKAECYKLFWFQAILNHVCKGQQEIRFEELIDDMIANAWYMVTEYHLNLGPRERKLEKVKKYWKLLSELAPIHEIYGENRLAPENISIDHFVPWSYVARGVFV